MQSLAFSGDGTRLVVATGGGNGDGALEVLTLDGSEEPRKFGVAPFDSENFKGFAYYYGVAINQNGSRIASAVKPNPFESSEVRLWDYSPSAILNGQRLEGIAEAYSIAFSPDGSLLVAGGAGGRVVMWNLAKGEKVEEVDRLTSAQGDVLALGFSADGSRVVAGGQDGILRLWEPGVIPLPKTVQSCGPGRLGNDNSEAMAQSPDGSLIVRGLLGGDNLDGVGGRLQLFDINQIPLSEPVRGHVRPTERGSDSKNRRVERRDSISCASFTEDGSKVVSLSTNGTIQLWELGPNSLKALDSFEGDRFTLSPYGEFIIVGHGSEVRLYNYTASIKPIGSSQPSRDDDWPSIYEKVGSSRSLQASQEMLCSKLARNMSRIQWENWVSKEIDYVKQCAELPVPTDH